MDLSFLADLAESLIKAGAISGGIGISCVLLGVSCVELALKIPNQEEELVLYYLTRGASVLLFALGLISLGMAVFRRR